MELNNEERQLIKAIASLGEATPYVVGGAVRDFLRRSIGHVVVETSHDLDIEVHRIKAEALEEGLAAQGYALDRVGQSFGVLKVRLASGQVVDVSLPRTEKLPRGSGPSHRGIVTSAQPYISLEEASARRDFTVNAIMYDPLNDEVLDPHGGIHDLHTKTLRATSPAFVEDPLRVLRAMRFAATLDFQLSRGETLTMCRTLIPAYETLPKERIWVEWERTLTEARTPSRALEVLQLTGWLQFYPELSDLIGCKQDPQWHPEGDVWTHTLLAVNAAARISRRVNHGHDERLVGALAALCHDLGKPSTSVEEDGHIRSPGHADAGTFLAVSFLERIGAPSWVRGHVVLLVRDHMAHCGAEPTPRNVRRLAHRLDPATLVQWEQLVEADASARTPAPAARPAKAWLDVAYKEVCAENEIKPIVTGKHLIARGLAPCPAFKPVLNRAFQAQLDGLITDEESASRWLSYELSAQG